MPYREEWTGPPIDVENASLEAWDRLASCSIEAPAEWRIMVNKLIAEVRRLRDERAWPARDLILKLPERDGGVVVAPEAMERYVAADQLADAVDDHIADMSGFRPESCLQCADVLGKLEDYRKAKGE